MFKLAQFRKRYKGNQQVPKYRTVPTLVSESSSCSHATNGENLVTLQAEQSSHNGVSGKPMKKLLAEEMSKDAAAKRKSQSVITKLMRLDGVGQKLRLWDNKDTMRSASVGAERFEKPRDSKSSSRNSVGKLGLKDTFDYPEASNVSDRSKKSSNRKSRVKISKEELAFMREKCEEICQESDEIRRQWRRKSNQELMEKFLRKPNSLFVKHVLDQQSRPSVRSERRDDDKLLDQSSGFGTNSSLRSSKIRLKVKEETNIPPRRIVVLKPSFKQTENATLYVPSLDDFWKQDLAINTRQSGSFPMKGAFDETKCSRHKCREARETAKGITSQMRDSFGSSGNKHNSIGKFRVRGYNGEKNIYLSDIDSEVVITLPSANCYTGRYDHDNHMLPRKTEIYVSREAKKRMSERWKMTHGYIDVEEIVQGSTLGEMLSTPDRQLRSENLNAVKGLDGTSGGAAYTGDQNTPMGISSRDGWKDEYIGSRRRSGSVPPSFGSRRHISSEHFEVLSDERFLIHQEPLKRERSKAVKGHVSERDSKNLRSNIKKLHPSQPRHAFTNKSSDYVPKIISSQKVIGINFVIDDLAEENPLLPQTPDGITSTVSVDDKKVNTDVIISSGSSSELLPLISTCAQINLEIDDFVEEKQLLPHNLDGISSTASFADTKFNADVLMCSDSSSELPLLLSTRAPGDGNSCALFEDLSNLQGPLNGQPEGDSDCIQFPWPEPEPEPEQEQETSEISKEADHHSPVSILKVPSIEDSSLGSDEVPSTEDSSPGSDSFGRLNADLQELRMHLQQLKMESGKSCISDNKEDDEEEEVAYEEEYDCWESSYTVDLLVESGLYGTDPGSFILNCYSSDCPLDPSLFDTLDKNYSDETTGSRLVRKLLFDHINELLSEIYISAMDSCPWVKTNRIGATGLKWKTGRVEDQLQKLLEIHEKEALKKVSDTVLDKQRSWYEPREAVDALGKEIQELLLDDLIKEVIKM